MKILMYSHDSYGLGHLRRTLALAEAFVARDPETSILIVTGSTISSAYQMSKGIDILKIPSAIKVDNGVYEPCRMSVSFDSLKRLRSRIIRSAAEAFDPNVFVVDKAPLGMKQEVSATLEFLKEERPHTLIVLGLRDVMDEPGRVRRSWKRKRIHEAIEKFYDLILVYGPREVYDPLPEYGLSAETLSRTQYVGYVGKRSAPEAVLNLPFPPGYVLVTVGGGGDGFELVKSYLEGLRLSEPSFDSLVVTGPLMAEGQKRRVDLLAKELRVEVMEFRPDMEALIQGAGAVVAMGGYNTTAELLATRKPAVIVPRVNPRIEQLIRAERLSRLGLVDMIHPRILTPALMRGKVEELLERGQNPRAQIRVDLSGASRAVEFVYAGLAAKHPQPVSA